MAGRPYSPGILRTAALRLEALFQDGCRLGARFGARLRLGRARACTADFRGRACHCDPGLALHLVHSEGLRESCDFVVDFGSNVHSPGRPVLPPEALAGPAAQLPAGAAIHVKTDLLDSFAKFILPSLARPFVLVTGDSDACSGLRHAALLEHPLLIRWFGQNCDLPGRHPKFTRIPIGLDNPVYTKLEKRLGFAVTMALGRTPPDFSFSRNDIGDQTLIQEIAASLPPRSSRPLKALCTFHQNQKIVRADVSSVPDREEALRILSNNPACHFVARRLRQRDCWALHGGFSFEVSPRGNGLDCFRTWEALYLGLIPIVKSSTLDPLYEDEELPVVIVRDWSEITEESLARWRVQMEPRFLPGSVRKLTLGYWVEKIKKASSSPQGAQ